MSDSGTLTQHLHFLIKYTHTSFTILIPFSSKSQLPKKHYSDTCSFVF